MDGHDLLERLRGTGDLESVGDAPEHERPVHRRNVPDLSECISHVVAGNRRMPVLKAMATTACERACLSVSYTHLTLPTIYPVLISVVAVSLKKKTTT